MKKFWFKIYQNQLELYRVLLSIVVAFSIVSFFPKGKQFWYEFQKGKIWQYDTFYAPFDFSLRKSVQEIEQEKREIKKHAQSYFSLQESVKTNVETLYQQKATEYFASQEEQLQEQLLKHGKDFLELIYDKGVLNSIGNISSSEINITKNQIVTPKPIRDIFLLNNLENSLKEYCSEPPYNNFYDKYFALFSEIISPNIVLNEALTKKILQNDLQEVVQTRGIVKRGDLIIEKGEIVNQQKWEILTALKASYQIDNTDSSSLNVTQYAYWVIVMFFLGVILLYLYSFHKNIYEDNKGVTFIFLNILMIVAFLGSVVQVSPMYIYLVPVCILPLLLKEFFNTQIAIFVHIMTILICGFIVQDAFLFTVVNALVLVALFKTVKRQHQRISLFVSVGFITLIHLVVYILELLLSDNNIWQFNWGIFGLIILNGFLLLFVQPLTYLYEKIFGLVSDTSLLELSDTNSKLLQELSEKALGTFHHSLQVANLAEAAAVEINANAMLVRVGALYHDIGKLKNPFYFTENQKTTVTPHDELSPKESARIIINHVIDGIEMARQHNIPDRIIDFIRTHHGTSLVYYFYKQEQENDPKCGQEEFRYPGPMPFSKETAILMMADSVEAASKSLKKPTPELISNLVEKIIEKQLEDRQYINADITLREIEKIKRIFKEKLINIYHLRIEYPE